jgi:tripeptidyl-peptidase-1
LSLRALAMKLLALFALAALALASATVVDETTRHVMFERTRVPRNWTRTGRASPLHEVRFIVALTQRNLDVLDETFRAVSYPRSPKYQQFLSIREILDIVSPPEEDRALVLSWLQSNGVRNVRDFGDAFEVRTQVVFAEQLLHAEFHSFQHDNGRVIVKAFGKYSIPAALRLLVHMIAGVSDFPVPRPAPKRPRTMSPLGTASVVPQTIQAMYGAPSTAPSTSSNSSQGVIEFEQQYYSPDDLQRFAQNVGLTIPALDSDHVVGFNDPSEPGIEAELDIQYIAAVGLGVTNWFWIEGGETWLYGFATHMFNTETVPWVNSISYGWNELDQCEDGIGAQECQQLGVNSTGYVQRVNAEFQKIGTRGISLLSASGDSGANGRTDEYCSEKHFNPDFPGSSPFITAVGATMVTNPQFSLPKPPPVCNEGFYSCISAGTEVAVSYQQAGFTSGGGFSFIGPMQDYQQAACQAYFKSGVSLPPQSYYNPTGRGYPDVAAFGSNVLIYSGGIEPVGGTSASSPIFAGLMALLNEESFKKNGKPLGFLNPFLYQMASEQPAAFTDVTVGSNACTESGCSLGCKGYNAYKGWDPVSGLGTPNYQQMLSYLQSNYAAAPEPVENIVA